MWLNKTELRKIDRFQPIKGGVLFLGAIPLDFELMRSVGMAGSSDPTDHLDP